MFNKTFVIKVLILTLRKLSKTILKLCLQEFSKCYKQFEGEIKFLKMSK